MMMRGGGGEGRRIGKKGGGAEKYIDKETPLFFFFPGIAFTYQEGEFKHDSRY